MIFKQFRPRSFEASISSPRHLKESRDDVSDLIYSENKSPKHFKKIAIFAAGVVLIGLTAYEYIEYNNNVKSSEEKNAVEVVLDHQGVIYDSVNIGPNNEIITSVPISQTGTTSQGSTKDNTINFFTKWMPGNTQVELYQKLETASGQTYDVYPITNSTNEAIAVKAFVQLQAQPSNKA